MGKKMKLPFLSKNEDVATRHPWQWTLCTKPKTLSFRASDDMFKTVNSALFDFSGDVETPESWFTSSLESTSFSTQSEDQDDSKLDPNTADETVIRGAQAQSERLFFEPRENRSIVKEATSSGFLFKESVVLAMESEDPYEDFKRSMEEMVEGHGLRDWECLEELLGWYLKVNGKVNHGFIVGAFVDLLVAMASNSKCTSDSTSFSSAASSFSSPDLSPLGKKEIDEDQETI
ncbi:Transcription repressor like [Actinidia chinensis var. chinensis]|uniref:Transcription repressor n=1 Tax=Actinidia chinensis var. chinensis TaxID=1590841 RepID=A0A2R6PWG6_ACTCC|nr:Transcription repressor like [Actinidia chinensis var. chinensis]